MKKTEPQKIHSITNHGFVPPHNAEMEETVLGCIMLENKSIHRVLDILQPDTFYVPVHADIWEAIIDLAQHNMPIDTMTVLKTLRKKKDNNEWYRDTIVKLTNSVVSSINLDTYARIIEEKAIARRTISVNMQTIARLYDDSEDINTVLSDADVNLFKARKALISSKSPTALSIGEEARQQILKGMSTGVVGVPFCDKDLDEMTGGLRGGRVYLFPARTRMGKTAVAAYFCYKAAEAGHASVFFTMEMGRVEFFYRMVSLRCRDMGYYLEYSKIDRAALSAEEFDIVDKAITYIQDMMGKKIIIDDTTFLNPLTIRSKILKYIGDYDIKAAWMDYIQIADLTGEGKSTTADQISAYMTKVKGIAKTLEIPMCVLSQVDRETEKNGQKGRAGLANGKGSGALEEASDVIIAMWRPEVNDPDPIDEKGVSERGILYMDVLKNKMGGTGLVKKPFDVATNFFETYNPFEDKKTESSPNFKPNVSVTLYDYDGNGNFNEIEPPF